MRDVDAIVGFWKTAYDASYPPAPPRPPAERQAFAATVQERFGFALPLDYARFLELCDGGQFDAEWVWGIGFEKLGNVLDNCSNYESNGQLFIGGSGNVDIYILRPDGRADIVGYCGCNVLEAFPSFTALLDRLIREKSDDEASPSTDDA